MSLRSTMFCRMGSMEIQISVDFESMWSETERVLFEAIKERIEDGLRDLECPEHGATEYTLSFKNLEEIGSIEGICCEPYRDLIVRRLAAAFDGPTSDPHGDL